MVESTEGGWIYFDLVPEEYELRSGAPDITGKLLCDRHRSERRCAETAF